MLGLSVFCIGLLPASVWAQSADSAAPAPVVTKTLLDRIMGGGTVFMTALMAISVFVFWLVTDSFMRTSLKRLMPAAQLTAIKDKFSNGDYRGAIEFCGVADSPLATVVRVGLAKVGLGKVDTESAIFMQLERERSIYSSSISYLSVVGVVTPMIGLTGTVFGMIKAFDTLGSSGMGDPTKLSAAIGTVLVATAGGLVVAIPAFTFYYILRNRINVAFRRMQAEVAVLFDLLPYDLLAGIHLDRKSFVPAGPDARTISPGGTAAPFPVRIPVRSTTTAPFPGQQS